jgi:hypothetical protein
MRSTPAAISESPDSFAIVALPRSARATRCSVSPSTPASPARSCASIWSM